MRFAKTQSHAADNAPSASVEPGAQRRQSLALQPLRNRAHLGDRRARRTSAIAGDLAADQVVRLDAGGALVDRA